MGRSRVALWDEVRFNLHPLPVLDGCYIHAAEWLETYKKRNWEHPDVVGVFGMLPPTDGVDPQIVARSLHRVLQTWRWETCWGWDFPWMAMAAARTHQPELAIHALLLDTPKNHYDQRGICGGWYLPGNGGLLYAVAMMAAGWDLAPGEAPLGPRPRAFPPMARGPFATKGSIPRRRLGLACLRQPRVPKIRAMVRSNLRTVPRGVIALGFVSMFMDTSSEMIHSLLPIFLVSSLGLTALSVGIIEGIAEATASITKIFAGVVSDWIGKRKPLVAPWDTDWPP